MCFLFRFRVWYDYAQDDGREDRPHLLRFLWMCRRHLVFQPLPGTNYYLPRVHPALNPRAGTQAKGSLDRPRPECSSRIRWFGWLFRFLETVCLLGYAHPLSWRMRYRPYCLSNVSPGGGVVLLSMYIFLLRHICNYRFWWLRCKPAIGLPQCSLVPPREFPFHRDGLLLYI